MSNNIPAKNFEANQTDVWFEALLRQLDNQQQRRLVSCQGSASWCLKVLQTLNNVSPDLLLLSNRELQPNAIAFASAETLLGREARLVVVDLFEGLNADVLCIATGLVKCGGIIVLLSPEPQHWSSIGDQYGIWQDRRVPSQNKFIEYFFDCIAEDQNACIQIKEGDALPHIRPVPNASLTRLVKGKTPDQAKVLSSIEDWLAHSLQRIALITAFRGRGKSTCLGFIVRQLSEINGLNVCVTAYSRQSAAALFEQYPSANFVAPDELINRQQPGEVLVIDEAAMLPSSMLQRLCELFERVIMATTTGGYEGTGQGFLLRFASRMDSERLLKLELHHPVRWATGDYLELWLDQTMQLKPELSESVIPAPKNIDCVYRVFDQNSDQLDTDLIFKIYRLMVSAHYRTRPSDLRSLMENPDLIPILAVDDREFKRGLPGICLLNREGGIDSQTCEQIFFGRRRPKGHLLAQMLTAQAGIRDFAMFKGLRIQRIAVEQDRRRQGIGRNLIRAIDEFASNQSYDYVGASFAFDEHSAGFWQSCGFSLVHIGFGQGKSSGVQSVAVIKTLNPDLQSKLEIMRFKLHQSLPLWLCQFLQNMNAVSAVALLRYSGFKASKTDYQDCELEAFTQGHKGFELCFVTLQSLVMQMIAQSTEQVDIHPWLVEKCVQNRDWNRLSVDPGCSGRKSIQNKLRLLVADLLKASA